MSYDGVQYGNRVDTTTERKLNAYVVDNILSSPTLASRVLGMGQPFLGKTYDYTIKVTDSGLGEWFTGLENLTTSASDTTVTLSYAHTAFTIPVVIPLLDAFANSGQTGTIPLAAFKKEEAAAEALIRIADAIYSDGTANRPLGLAAIVDDASLITTIGGQSRNTYTNLKATNTASGGGLSLAKMATLFDAISAAGMNSEEPTIIMTTKTIWSLYEQLLAPTVRMNSVGYESLPVLGNALVKKADLKGGSGFTSLTYRGIPVAKDDRCTSGVMFMLNERYFEWRGRTIVPNEFAGELEKVSLGAPATMKGAAGELDMPTDYGWFYQKAKMLPNNAGLLSRFYVIGQITPSQFRRQGKLTGITGLA